MRLADVTVIVRGSAAELKIQEVADRPSVCSGRVGLFTY